MPKLRTAKIKGFYSSLCKWSDPTYMNCEYCKTHIFYMPCMNLKSRAILVYYIVQRAKTQKLMAPK